jgi:YegS/Rv2252/BmrU family lipid kinase
MSRKRILIIHNPTSGRGRADFMSKVAVALTDLGARVDIVVTDHPGHGTELAARVEPDSQDAIVAAGGDGTINEVLNGLYAQVNAPPMGIIPLGTANVLALELGIAGKPAVIARILYDGPIRNIYPGIIKRKGQPDRLFAMMAGVGLDARIVAGVSSTLKRFIGKGAYIIEAAWQWLRRRLPDYDLEIDKAPYKAGSVIITNGRLYAGHFEIAPDADLGASGFKILLLKGSRGQLLGNGIAMAGNFLARKKGVRMLSSTKIVLAGPSGEPLQADGDLVTQLPVTIEASKKSVKVISYS